MSELDDDWAAAMREQEAQERAQPASAPQGAAGASATAPDWATKLQDQTRDAAPRTLPEAGAVPPAATPATHVFQQFAQPVPRPSAGLDLDMERVRNIPVQLTAELGTTRLHLGDLLKLQQGSVVELDGEAGQPLSVKINGYLIAMGEVVQVGDASKPRFGIRLIEIVNPSERIARLAAQ